jgi:hypothetical protein
VPRPIEQLRAICRNPRPTSNFNRRTSLILRTDNLLAGKLILPFEGEAACHCVVQRRSACGNHSGEAEHSYGIGLKLFSFVPEPVFTFIPEHRSESWRIRVRLAPDSPTASRKTPAYPPRLIHASKAVSDSLIGGQNHRLFATRDQCPCKITHLDRRTSNGSSIPIPRSAGK